MDPGDGVGVDVGAGTSSWDRISGVTFATICKFSFQVGCCKHPCNTRPGTRKSSKNMLGSVAANVDTMLFSVGQNTGVLNMGPHPINSFVVVAKFARTYAISCL